MDQNNEIRIDLSKTKLVLIVLGSLIFVAVGVWMLGLESKEIESSTRYNDTAFVNGIAWVAIGFFGLCAVIGIRKMFDKRPGLVISPVGILDNSSGVSGGLIPWEDITEVTQYQIQSQIFVSIMVVDPYEYVKRGNLLKRMAGRANIKMCGTPLNISSNSLKISHDDLFELLSSAFQEYGKKTDGTDRNSGELS